MISRGCPEVKAGQVAEDRSERHILVVGLGSVS